MCTRGPLGVAGTSSAHSTSTARGVGYPRHTSTPSITTSTGDAFGDPRPRRRAASLATGRLRGRARAAHPRGAGGAGLRVAGVLGAARPAPPAGLLVVLVALRGARQRQ